MLRQAALEGDLVNQIKYSTNTELVSSDIIGTSGCSIFDSNSTLIGKNEKSITLYVWYDNEFGYTKQVIRLVNILVK